MHKLPRSAQLCIVLIALLGIGAAVLASLVRFRHSDAPLWELFVFIGIAVLAGGKKVSLIRNLPEEEAGSMSLGFAITFAGLLRFDPSAAVAIGMASCLSSCLIPHRQALHQIFFNVGLAALEALAGGFVFFLLSSRYQALEPQTFGALAVPQTFAAVAGASMTFFFVNTFGVATIIALCAKKSPLQIWRQTFLWTAPSYFAAASISALTVAIFKGHTGAVFLFVAPVAYLMYSSYASYASRAEEKQKHIEALQVSQAQLADLYLATIKSLALAIDAKDQHTHQHILRVQTYAVGIATEMGFAGPELDAITTGALLHDIGKLGVPEYVLLKPGRLTKEEFEKIKKHPEIGAAILDPVQFPWPVIPIVRHHHEKWDGTGYPDGLAGEDIPLTARIMAVADVFDALTSSRSYRKAWDFEKAKTYVKEQSGSHFDPAVVEPFLRVIDRILAEMEASGLSAVAQPSAASGEPIDKATAAARDISRSSSELWALYEVAHSLSTSIGQQDTLEFLSRKLKAIFPDTLSVFLLLNETQDRLKVHVAAGPNEEFFRGAESLGDASSSLQALKAGTTRNGDYDHDDLMLGGCDGVEWREMRSALVVPVKHPSGLLGTINLYHSEPHAFSDYDAQLLESIAERAAMALVNSMLFERTKGDAKTDPLTGLYNLRHIGEEAATLIERGEAFSLLCLDLDSFKPINDNFGHQRGDEVLIGLARLFRHAAPPGAVVARYGGDEFLVMPPGAAHDQAETVAAHLQRGRGLRRGAEPPRSRHSAPRRELRSASYPQTGQDWPTLLSTADAAMYAQKTQRKLRSLVSKPEVPEFEAA